MYRKESIVSNGNMNSENGQYDKQQYNNNNPGLNNSQIHPANKYDWNLVLNEESFQNVTKQLPD